jgi:regulator of nonsense transcripts 1
MTPSLLDCGELNSSQQAAVSLAMSQRVALIQGPPGTGKSHVCIAIAKAAAKEGKVLVCAPSNVVTDHLAEKLSELEGLSVVRLVARSREELLTNTAIAVHELCSQQSSMYAQAREKMKELDRKRKSDAREMRRLHDLCFGIEADLLDKADVIVTTCIAAGDPRISGRRFRSVIIDEATQDVEPSCLIPAVLSTHRVVLVGDHKQLGPVVLDRKANVTGLSRPLFSRLVALNIPRIRLNVQYRMHPEIAEFPSMAFYNATLQNGVTAVDRPMPSFIQSLGFGDLKPVTLWDIPSEEEWDASGRSLINRIEARRVKQVVEMLPRCADVGVITFYDGQRTLLSDSIGDICEVASVDGFQGREKGVIILSTVRGNSKGLIGFLHEFRRLNVAVTRAKFALVICANVRTLQDSQDHTWLKLLEHLDAKDCIVRGATVGSWKKKLSNLL